MNLSTSSLLALPFTLIIVLSFTAHAQEPVYDHVNDAAPEELQNQETWRTTKPWAKRTLVPHRLEVQLLIGPTSAQELSVMGARQTFGVNIHHSQPRSNATTLPIGLAVGVLPHLELGVALPIGLSPGGFGDLPIWLTYQFFRTEHIQIGARFTLYTPTDTHMGVQGGIPLRMTSETIRVDTGAFVTYTFDDANHMRIFVPAVIGFRILQSAFVGVQTEFSFDLEDNQLQFTMPIYGFIGYTINGGLGPIDLGLRFGFDHFVRAGRDIEHVVEMREFSFTLGGNMALQF